MEKTGARSQELGVRRGRQNFKRESRSLTATLAEPSIIPQKFSDSNITELLLCCARTHIATETAERIRTLLQQDIDWTYLIQTAARHGVMPLLYRSLNATCPELVPKSILSQLRNFFHTNAQRNLFLTHELLKLLNLFAAEEIAAIPYKGPVLAASVYGNLALRTFNDLDLIVHQQDIPTIKSLLLSQGYRWKPRISQLLQAKTGLYVRSSYLYDDCFERLDSEGKCLYCLEIHWETNPRHIFLPLNPEQLWKNLSQVSLANRLVPSLPPEELLPLLCINGAKDHWLWLKAVCDVAELIAAHPEMDWEKTRNCARILGRDKILLLGLSLASELMAVELPANVRRWLETEPVVNLMSQKVRQWLFNSSNQQLGILNKALFNLRLRDSLQDKVRYCWFAIIQQLDRTLTKLISS
jgi:hypothetical protein